ncbi:hypothetical protein Lal_00015269 [Lupinus albus]|nr:hypothetical protein Lal_00015269 [Lupinus albus]
MWVITRSNQVKKRRNILKSGEREKVGAVGLRGSCVLPSLTMLDLLTCVIGHQRDAPDRDTEEGRHSSPCFPWLATTTSSSPIPMSHQNPFLESLSSIFSCAARNDLTTSSPLVTTSNPAYKTWCRQDCLIYGAILTTLSNEVLSLESQTKTSHDLWTHLKSAYAKASHNHLKQLKERLCVASKGTQFITTYMHFLMQTTNLLASLSSHVYVEDMTDHVLRGLDDGYRAVIDGVNARDIPFSFDDLLEKLLIQELSIVAA